MMQSSSMAAGIPIPSAGRNGVRGGISDPRSASVTPLGLQQHVLHGHGSSQAGGEGSSGSSETITSPTNSLTRQRRPRSRKDKEKRFTCDHPGCDKTYTRAEHLTRHQLNHTGEYRFICRVDPRCGKKFVRGDLLSRHEERHQNKKEKQRAHDEGADGPPRVIAPSDPHSPPTDKIGSINIPVSTPDSDFSNDVDESPDAMAIDSVSIKYETPGPSQQSYQQSSYSASPPFVRQRVASPGGFNSGFVAVNHYSSQGIPVQNYGQTYGSSATSNPINIPSRSFTGSLGLSPSIHETSSIFAGDMMMGADFGFAGNENWHDIMQTNSGASYQWQAGTFPDDQFLPDAPMMYATQSASDMPYDRRHSVYYANQIPVGTLLSDGAMFPNSPVISQETRDMILTDHLQWGLNSQMVIQYHDDLTPEALSNYLNVYWSEFHSQYPILHRPTTTISRSAHLALFVSMITIGMSLGGSGQTHELAVRIHEDLRWQIYSSKSFKHPAKLWEMQTLLLREIFDKMMAGRHQHEMAFTFHGALVNLMRRGTTLEGYMEHEEPHRDHVSLEHASANPNDIKQWHDFVEKECTKRAAFLAFIIDSQHSLIFGHLMVLHAQELNITPPCKDDEWSAPTAGEWQRVHQRNHPKGGSKELGFIEILRMFTNDPHAAKERISLDPFGSFIALHGLISVKWHLNQKAIGMGTTTTSQSGANSPTRANRDREYWKVNMERALLAWRHSTQGHYTGMSNTVKFNRASLALYRIANITLYAGIVELQIIAGLPKIMGRPVSQNEQHRVLWKMSTNWIQSEGAVKAVHHAVKLLSDTLFASPDYLPISNPSSTNREAHARLQRADYALDGILHGKWCLYLATLTIWAYGALTSINQSSEGIVNGLNMYGQGVQGAGGEFYTSHDFDERDERSAWMHAQAYLKAIVPITTPPDKAKLFSASARVETRGVIIIIRNLLQHERWELRTLPPPAAAKWNCLTSLVREGSRVLSRILGNQHLIATTDFESLQIYEMNESRRMSVVDGSGGDF